MKCPQCGHEISDGYLLCENCGHEIQMVPDFEPEVEQSIEESLSNVVEDLITSDSSKDKETGNESHKNMFVLGLGCVFLLALIPKLGGAQNINLMKSTTFVQTIL